MSKIFNTTGVCLPEKHYMVDLTSSLEKIKKLTGLDLREFEDAIVFKVALMVKKYLSSNPVKY